MRGNKHELAASRIRYRGGGRVGGGGGGNRGGQGWGVGVGGVPVRYGGGGAAKRAGGLSHVARVIVAAMCLSMATGDVNGWGSVDATRIVLHHIYLPSPDTHHVV